MFWPNPNGQTRVVHFHGRVRVTGLPLSSRIPSLRGLGRWGRFHRSHSVPTNPSAVVRQSRRRAPVEPDETRRPRRLCLSGEGGYAAKSLQWSDFRFGGHETSNRRTAQNPSDGGILGKKATRPTVEWLLEWHAPAEPYPPTPSPLPTTCSVPLPPGTGQTHISASSGPAGAPAPRPRARRLRRARPPAPAPAS